MLRDSRKYFEFTAILEGRIAALSALALNPKTPFDDTQAARIRVRQLREVLEVATGVAVSLP